MSKEGVQPMSATDDDELSGFVVPRVLTSAKLAQECLPLDLAMDLIEAALSDPRAARIEPVTLNLDDGTAFRIVAGATGGSAVVRFGAAGRFWATGRAHLKSWAAVFDPEDGQLRALLRYPFTGTRVAATMGVAARGLVDGPAPVAMIGSGNYSFGTLEAVHAGLGISSLTVASRTPAHAEALAERVSGALAVPATTAPSAREAVAEAALVVVGTDSLEPVLHADWLRAEQVILSYGLPTELDRSVYLAADVFAASDTELEFASGFWRHPLLDADERPERLPLGLGEVLKDGADGLVVVRDGGGGVGDAALAAGLAAEIERRGLGVLGE